MKRRSFGLLCLALATAVLPARNAAAFEFQFQNCGYGPIEVAVYNINDSLRWIPYSTARLPKGQTSRLTCVSTDSCAVHVREYTRADGTTESGIGNIWTYARGPVFFEGLNARILSGAQC